jgi:hypothetical protein
MEFLDLLPNFLIATDYNITAGQIIIASTFEFRGPADLSFLLEQHGGRQHPPHRLQALRRSSRPK